METTISPEEAFGNLQQALEGRGNLPQQAKNVVYSYAKTHLDITDDTHFTVDDVYVVWFCKTLQNWKALLSTVLPDGMYYEVTFNGDQGEIYLDAYKKFDNIMVKPG